MLRPLLTRLPLRRTLTTMSTPMEDLMRDKLAHEFTPTTLIIRNDSHKHAHHAAMADSTSKETHFQYPLPCPLPRNTQQQQKDSGSDSGSEWLMMCW
ncbi:hypothetical protein PENSTE_c002G01724 [Penicillium steckii]|uniref:Uncharacterized protein n=1 Tax=Penicillium steckii TaxID=303698 RepID=A0A1V6TSP6_9EURO|nr:hypothetical protein PENSTE_c002G01724 [Penicillium steckii]